MYNPYEGLSAGDMYVPLGTSVQEGMSLMTLARAFEGTLAEGVRAAWSSISSKMLDNLASSMLHHKLGSISETGDALGNKLRLLMLAVFLLQTLEGFDMYCGTPCIAPDRPTRSRQIELGSRVKHSCWIQESGSDNLGQKVQI